MEAVMEAAMEVVMEVAGGESTQQTIVVIIK